MEVEGFHEKDLQKMQATELVIKNKKFWLTIPVRCIVKFYDMQNNGCNLKTFFISGSSVLVNQDLQKIWQEE